MRRAAAALAPVSAVEKSTRVDNLSGRLDALEATLAALETEQARQGVVLDAIRELLDRGRGPRDQGDEALLVALAGAALGHRFTAAEVFRFAAVEPALAAALDQADMETPQQLGLLFRRLAGRNIAGLRLERTDDVEREGIVWRLQDLQG